MAAILLFLGLTFLAAEAILPLHGTSAIGGLAAIAIAVAIFFSRSVWAGLGATTGSLLVVPIVWWWINQFWPRTPVGRRIVLGRVEPQQPSPKIAVGMKGVVLTELRPGGMCEFGNVRVTATSEHGFIAAGSNVRVVGLDGERARVRAEECSQG